MTIDRETVIRLAKQCTAPEWQDETPGWHMGMDYVKFAALVLEHERKPLMVRKAKDVDGNCDVVLVADLHAAHGITNKEISDAESS